MTRYSNWHPHPLPRRKMAPHKFGMYFLASLLGCLLLVTFLLATRGPFSDLDSQSCFFFRMFETPKQYMGTNVDIKNISLGLSDITKFKNMYFEYDAFRLPEPRFVSEGDKTLFYKNAVNKENLGEPSSSRLRGVIQLVKNGTVHESYGCGWSTDINAFYQRPQGRVRKKYDILCPILVPQSNSFQHFLDGVMPKIIQSYALLTSIPSMKLMIYRPWDPVIEEILEKLNFPPEKVLYYERGYYAADYLINTCVTPPVHPKLWQDARRVLGSPARLINTRDSLVILLTRKGSRNVGRTIFNEREVGEYLKRRYSNRYKLFTGGYTLSQATEMFGNARVIIGVHGGAFYNMMFSPSDTHIVELLPTTDTGTVVPGSVAHTIVWKMAHMLGQTYWRLSHTPATTLGDVNVDMNRLQRVLDHIDNRANEDG